MSIKVIAFGMVFILAALFIYLRFFEKKLRSDSFNEALYAEAVLKYKQDNDLAKCLNSITDTLKISESDARSLLKKDRIID